MSYLQSRELTAGQLRELEDEQRPLEIPADALLEALETALAEAEAIVRAIDPATLAEPRTVGRKRLPTTVIGLLTHIAEHIQRHVGQAISAARWIRAVLPEVVAPQ